jgi:hypothetical protein
VEIVPPVLMLAGFAVENLVKGRMAIGVNPSGRLPEKFKTHDLLALARQAGIQFDETEEDLLKMLTVAAEWHGRYPVPITADDYFREFRDSPSWIAGLFGSPSLRNARALIGRLRRELEAALQQNKLPQAGGDDDANRQRETNG